MAASGAKLPFVGIVMGEAPAGVVVRSDQCWLRGQASFGVVPKSGHVAQKGRISNDGFFRKQSGPRRERLRIHPINLESHRRCASRFKSMAHALLTASFAWMPKGFEGGIPSRYKITAGMIGPEN
jgi:hypothetical protein